MAFTQVIAHMLKLSHMLFFILFICLFSKRMLLALFVTLFWNIVFLLAPVKNCYFLFSLRVEVQRWNTLWSWN